MANKKTAKHTERYKDDKYEIYYNEYSEKYVLKEFLGGNSIKVIGRYDTYREARNVLQVYQEYDKGHR